MTVMKHSCHRRKISIPLIGVGVLLVSLSACGGSAQQSSASPSAVATKPATVLTDIQFSGVHTPLFAGKAEGYFKAERIDLNIEAGRGSATSASDVASGAAQFALVDTTASLETIIKGAKLTVLAIVEQTSPDGLCTIVSRHPLSSYADLQGLTIGASAGDAYMVPLPSLLTQNGLTPGYTVVTMSSTEVIPELLAGKVDVGACGHHGLAGYQASAQKEGLTLDQFLYADHGFNAVGWSLITQSSLVKSDPALVQGFVDAFVKSIEYSIQHPTAAVQEFVDANPEDAMATMLAEWQGEIQLIEGAPGTKLFSSQGMAATVAFANSTYNVHLTVGDVYTSTFINKATTG